MRGSGARHDGDEDKRDGMLEGSIGGHVDDQVADGKERDRRTLLAMTERTSAHAGHGIRFQGAKKGKRGCSRIGGRSRRRPMRRRGGDRTRDR
jgi:hypothetical protein